MAHPTEAELRALGQEILDLLVTQTIKEGHSRYQAGQEAEPPIVPAYMDQAIEEYIRDTYSFLPDAFARFAEPRPEAFDDAISQSVSATMVLEPSLERVEPQGLGEIGRPGGVWPDPSYVTDAATRYPTTVLERVRAVTTEVATWEGTAADAFHMQYMNEFELSLEDQHAAVFALAIALDANKRIFEYVGDDILEIGEKTKNALRHVTDKDPTGYIVAFTVGAAVAGVVSAGMATAAYAVLVASAATMSGGAAAFLGATAEEYEAEIEGATTQEIMVSVTGRTSDLHGLIRAEEVKIRRFLESVHDWFHGRRAQVEMGLPEAYTTLDGASYEEIKEDFLHT